MSAARDNHPRLLNCQDKKLNNKKKKLGSSRRRTTLVKRNASIWIQEEWKPAQRSSIHQNQMPCGHSMSQHVPSKTTTLTYWSLPPLQRTNSRCLNDPFGQGKICTKRTLIAIKNVSGWGGISLMFRRCWWGHVGVDGERAHNYLPLLTSQARWGLPSHDDKMGMPLHHQPFQQ